ncbi:MAG TPA: hypothetical protein VFZ80_04645 [Acidimicrobiia bacterium]
MRLRENGPMDISLAPDELARELVDSADADWLRTLVDALDREVRTAPLSRLVSLWDLSNAGAARIFGVSRQAFSKWLAAGPPADRVDDVAAVDNITGLLDRYVKRERIAAVVRRRSENLGDRSIIECLEAGEYQQTASQVRATFDLRRVQP